MSTANNSIAIKLTRGGTPGAWQAFAANPLDFTLSFETTAAGNVFTGATALRVELHPDRLINPERPALAVVEIPNPTGTTASGTFTAPQLNQDLRGQTQRPFWLVVHATYADEDIVSQVFQLGTLTLLAHPASLTVADPPTLASALTPAAADARYLPFNNEGTAYLEDVPLLDATAHCAAEIDRRIAGKTASDSTKKIFTTENHSTGTYVRNAACWAASVNLTGYGVARQTSGTWATQLGFAAITARHVVLCHHATIPDGSTLRFVTAGNVVVDRVLSSSAQIGSTDLRIGTLSAALPDTITPLYLAPPTASFNLRRTGLPVFVTDQENKALVAQMTSETGLGQPGTSPRSLFYELAVTGDSGHVWSAVFEGRPVALSHFYSPTEGPDYAAVYSSILTACGSYTPAVPVFRTVDWAAIKNAPSSTGGGVTSFASRTGDVTAVIEDLSDAGDDVKDFLRLSNYGEMRDQLGLTAWATKAYPANSAGILTNNGTGTLTWAAPSSAGVTTWNSRSGDVVPVIEDLSDAGDDAKDFLRADYAGMRAALGLTAWANKAYPTDGAGVLTNNGSGTLSWSSNITGNAATATALATPRSIFGQTFDGTGNISGGAGVNTALAAALDGTGGLASKAYADSLVVGLLDDRGNHNASGNVFPSSGGSGTAGAILKGDLWTISVAGTLGGTAVTAGDVLRALTDTPGQTAANWSITENNLGYVPQNTAGTLALGGFSSITGTLTLSHISGLGTGVATALAVNTGSTGAFAVIGGALGTPASGNGSNLTNLNGSNIATGTVAEARIDSALARLANPTFTGTPAAPTAIPGTNTTQVATTAFVTAAVAAGGGGGGSTAVQVKTANYTAVSGDIIDADTAGGAWTLTLPASPSAGAIVTIHNSKSNWATNNLTIGRNGSTIDGAAADYVLRKTYLRVVLLYSGSTWQIMLSSQQVDIQVFVSSGTYYKPPAAYDYEVLLVGGGGGGGGGRCDAAGTVRYGGGGAAAAAIVIGYGSAAALGATESVTVGAGGSGGNGVSTNTNGAAGSAGGSSIFGPYTASGGAAAGGGSGASGSAGTGSANRSGAYPAFAISTLAGGAGSNGSASGSNGTATTTSALPTGGGGGGGLSAANAASSGGSGGAVGGNVIASTAAAAGGTSGGSGTAGTTTALWVGTGGGGGASDASNPAGAGGNGAFPGGGGGGGGASVTGQLSGAGGTGGAGFVIITTYCSP